MEPQIIYEDKYIIIINKPPGWVVNESVTTEGLKVIQTWLKENLIYDIVNSKVYRSGIVHRLDKETSGILLIARNPISFKILQEEFKKRKVEKSYIALVHGKIPKFGEINVPLGRLPWNRKRFGIIPGGREAITIFKLISYYRNKEETLSLVNFFPKTGRTHQIRVHAKYLGFPIVSDSLYAGRKINKKDRKFCPRLFLHANKIIFYHPETGEKIQFSTKISNDLKLVLTSLEKIDNYT